MGTKPGTMANGPQQAGKRPWPPSTGVREEPCSHNYPRGPELWTRGLADRAAEAGAAPRSVCRQAAALLLGRGLMVGVSLKPGVWPPH